MLEVVVHGRAMRIGAADHDVLPFLLQVTADAGKRAAGADGADEAVDLAVCLLPDFRSGRIVMGFRIVQVIPLISEQDAVGLALAQAIGEASSDMLVVVR